MSQPRADPRDVQSSGNSGEKEELELILFNHAGRAELSCLTLSNPGISFSKAFPNLPFHEQGAGGASAPKFLQEKPKSCSSCSPSQQEEAQEGEAPKSHWNLNLGDFFFHDLGDFKPHFIDWA